MQQQRISLPLAALSVVLLCPALYRLAICPSWAGVYKCREPDGHISYQETPCAPDSDGGALTPNTTPPSGANAPGPSKAYTVEGQLKALESARRQTRKKREKTAAPRSTQTKTGDYDAARCAKHRAEVARWRRNVRNGYRDRDEREWETQMLIHHEALVQRHCPPEH
jgi:hypothetical protein